jgi:hypothetical protein
VEREADAREQEFVSLHAQWNQAIWQVSCCPARTSEGQRAKAIVLLAALRVVLESDPSPYELLAASLARDLAG